jgi:uncharacterized membrane protein YhaH (DUF805 family)
MECAAMKLLSTLFSFKGKISRKAYWGSIFLLFVCLAIVVSLIEATGLSTTPFYDLINFFVVMAVMVPFLALQVKRCHSIGWSGWWSLLSFVPYLHWAWWLLLGTITSAFIQQQKDRVNKEAQERQKQRAREAEAIARKKEAQDRIKRAEEYVLSSGDPRAISLLLLARKMPSNYAQILGGGMKKGNGTLKNALGIMTGVVAGSVVATASVAAIQEALDNM